MNAFSLNVKQFYLTHRFYLSSPVSDGNEGVLRIPQSSSITGLSPPDCLMSDTGHSLKGLESNW